MGQRFDQIKELSHGAGPAVANHQGHRVGPTARFMDEVHVYAVNRCLEMGETVDPRFLRAPIKAINPIGAKLFEIVHISAVVPTTIIRHFVPRVVFDPPKDTLNSFVWDVKVERG